MDQNVNTPPTPTIENGTFTSLLRNKKLLVLFCIIGIIVLLFVAWILLGSNNSTNSKSVTNNASQENETSTTDSNPNTTGLSEKSQASPTIPLLSPERVAENFYTWYITHPARLSSGEYKTRSDITNEYKMIMSRYVKRGLSEDHDDVFNCGVFPLPSTMQSLKAREDIRLRQALVILQDVKNKKDLFQIKLQKVGDAWLVRDVWCAS